MRNRTSIFILGYLLLFIPEILRVYLIMPFPGSQVSDTISVAYFLHCYINVFRFLGVIIISFPVYHYWLKGKLKQKIVSGIFIALYALIFYLFNFIAEADKMFVQPKHKTFLSSIENKVNERSIVIGVDLNGEAKAFPINIIGYHHQIQDTIGGKPVIITYCTVCRSARAFSPFVNGNYEKFRLVGMDHFNAMFEDASTGSWWRQENGEAITGKMKGNFLDEIPSQQMTLKEWMAEHPNTKILQPDSDFISDYKMLRGYDYGLTRNELEYTDTGSWKMKSWVIGVSTRSGEKAYDWNELKKQQLINDTIQAIPVLLFADKDSMSFHVFVRQVDGQQLFFERSNVLQNITDSSSHSVWNNKGECVDGVLKGKQLNPLPSHLEYWHSWKQFHPHTTVYQPQQN